MSDFIRIGFDDEPEEDELFEEITSEEALHREKVRTREKKTNIYLSPERQKLLLADFETVSVHEFGDDYHLSEEERIAKNEYYEAFKKLSRAKKKYRKLDEFVVVMREAMKCLDSVAETNGLYPPDKFKKLYFRNKIHITGLELPKYNGKDKKEINWTYIWEFIFSDKDPAELMKTKNEQILTRDEIYENRKVLFSKEEFDYIMNHKEKGEDKYINRFFDIEEDELEGTNVVPELNTKEAKNFFRNSPEITGVLKDIKRKMKSSENLERMSYDLTEDDFEEIERYDRKRGFISDSDMPEFKGDLMNDDDYNKYMHELEEYEMEHVRVDDGNGRLRTLAEIRETENKEFLEDNGWNILNLYNNREKSKKIQKAIKADKKLEKKLKSKLTKVQEKRERKEGTLSSSKEKSKSKKKGKKQKKKNKEQKDYDRQREKVSKYNKRYRHEVKESTENILMDVAGCTTEDFKDWKEESLDWSWDSIMSQDLGGK